MRRRAILIGAGLSLPARLAMSAVTTGMPTDGHLAFDIMRKGERIGTHEALFGGRTTLIVRIAIRIVVRLGPIPLYRYTHDATERWSNDSFLSLRSTTDDNGSAHEVEAQADGRRVRIGADRRAAYEAPAGSLPLTHWNRACLVRPLFDPMTGAMLQETVSRQDDETIVSATWAPIIAQHYRYQGSVGLDVWYDTQGIWSGLRTVAKDGSVIDYRRAQ
jgi:hypothetical protein